MHLYNHSTAPVFRDNGTPERSLYFGWFVNESELGFENLRLLFRECGG